jgi:hypothetical protein
MSNPQEQPQDQNYQGHPLTDNLSTARSIRQTGEIDMRKFTNIDDEDILFLIYARIRSQKSRTWAMLYDEYLNSKVGVGGLGMRYAIRGESVRKGIATDVTAEVPKRPNPLARLTYDREGEERYQRWKKETELEPP